MRPGRSPRRMPPGRWSCWARLADPTAGRSAWWGPASRSSPAPRPSSWLPTTMPARISWSSCWSHRSRWTRATKRPPAGKGRCSSSSPRRSWSGCSAPGWMPCDQGLTVPPCRAWWSPARSRWRCPRTTWSRASRAAIRRSGTSTSSSRPTATTSGSACHRSPTTPSGPISRSSGRAAPRIRSVSPRRRRRSGSGGSSPRRDAATVPIPSTTAPTTMAAAASRFSKWDA